MLRVCVVRVDVNLLLLLLDNFQRSDVSPPFAIYLSLFLLLLLFREGKQSEWLAYVQYIQEGKKSKWKRTR